MCLLSLIYGRDAILEAVPLFVTPNALKRYESVSEGPGEQSPKTHWITEAKWLSVTGYEIVRLAVCASVNRMVVGSSPT